MSKIPEDEIRRIKLAVNLVEVIRGKGIELKPQGKQLVGRCPFHEEDNTPSFFVDPQKGEWNCFGCSQGGDVIKFVMLYEKKDFRSAVESLSGSPRIDQPVKAAKEKLA